MRFTHLLACSLLSAAAALPQGFATWFLEGCPPNWSNIPSADGRLIVSVTDASIAGLTVNDPLGDQEDRAHKHTFSGTLELPSKHIAADGCCNADGTNSGDHSYTGTTDAGTSGVPMTQLYFCRLNVNDGSFLPFGAIGYFDPSVTSCPANWAPYTAANGRFIIPGYITTGGEPVSSDAAPLASLEDRTHKHAYTATANVADTSYVGIDGCCNDSPAPTGGFPITNVTDEGSTGLPYIQLLTCISQNATFNTSMPLGAIVLSPSIGCQTGWVLASYLSGRFLVALPPGGQPGADFGAPSLLSNATNVSPAAHDFSGTVPLPVNDVGLASGCCANGYAASGQATFTSTTFGAGANLPYIMVPACVQSP